MNVLVLGFLIAAFAVVQILIGGTRMLYSIPAWLLLAVAGLAAAFSREKTHAPVRTGCLLSGLAFCGYVLVRNWFSPIDYISRTDFVIVTGSLIVYLVVALFLTRSKYRLAFFLALLVLGL